MSRRVPGLKAAPKKVVPFPLVTLFRNQIPESEPEIKAYISANPYDPEGYVNAVSLLGVWSPHSEPLLRKAIDLAAVQVRKLVYPDTDTDVMIPQYKGFNPLEHPILWSHLSVLLKRQLKYSPALTASQQAVLSLIEILSDLQMHEEHFKLLKDLLQNCANIQRDVMTSYSVGDPSQEYDVEIIASDILDYLSARKKGTTSLLHSSKTEEFLGLAPFSHPLPHQEMAGITSYCWSLLFENEFESTFRSCYTAFQNEMRMPLFVEKLTAKLKETTEGSLIVEWVRFLYYSGSLPVENSEMEAKLVELFNTSSKVLGAPLDGPLAKLEEANKTTKRSDLTKLIEILLQRLKQKKEGKIERQGSIKDL